MTAAGTGARPRLESVDVVRGVIMIVMALDHTRDFLAVPGLNPVNLDTTTPALFFTRWITYFCAPVFFLLTGTGAFLSLRRKSRAELSRFLWTRGLWLIFLELVATRVFGWQFNLDYHVTMLVVLWALGWAMIVLAGLIYLPLWSITAFGALLVVGHNLFDGVQSTNPIWMVLHTPGFVLNTPEHSIFVAYPLIPWIGVTALGYSLGQVFGWEAVRRRAFLLRAGIVMTVGFVLLRFVNVYGDPRPWSHQPTGLFTLLSFLNTNKYPPSLLYLLMTLGPALLFLRAVDGGTPQWLRPAIVFGRVPMFYYILHIPLLHLIALATALVRFGGVHWMFESPTLDKFPITPPPGWGFSLPVLYLVWAAVVLMLYPLCRWFAALKQRRRDLWLSYF